MALDVVVNIAQATIPGRAAFGIPILAAANASKAVDYMTYTNLNALAKDFDSKTDIYAAAQLLWSQDMKPRTIAVHAVSGEALEMTGGWMDEEWRQLIVVTPGTTTVETIAAAIEAKNDKMFFTSISIEDAGSKDDAALIEAWKAAIKPLAKFRRTTAVYYDDTVKTPEAAVVGATAGRDPGSFTYKNMILRGITPLKLSDGVIDAINGTDETGHAFTIVRKAGDVVTTEGKVCEGEYADVIDSIDWLTQNIAYDTQKLLNTQPKIPYTDGGITQLANATESVLKKGFNMGMIAPIEENSPIGDYSVNKLPKSEVDPTDVANRHYPGISFTFMAAGAIHDAEINGTMLIA